MKRQIGQNRHGLLRKRKFILRKRKLLDKKVKETGLPLSCSIREVQCTFLDLKGEVSSGVSWSTTEHVMKGPVGEVCAFGSSDAPLQLENDSLNPILGVQCTSLDIKDEVNFKIDSDVTGLFCEPKNEISAAHTNVCRLETKSFEQSPQVCQLGPLRGFQPALNEEETQPFDRGKFRVLPRHREVSGLITHHRQDMRKGNEILWTMNGTRNFRSSRFHTFVSHQVYRNITPRLGSAQNDTSVKLWVPKLVCFEVENDNWMSGQIEEFQEPTKDNQDTLHKSQESQNTALTFQESNDGLVQDKKQESSLSWKRAIRRRVESIARRAIQGVTNLHRRN